MKINFLIVLAALFQDSQAIKLKQKLKDMSVGPDGYTPIITSGSEYAKLNDTIVNTINLLNNNGHFPYYGVS